MKKLLCSLMFFMVLPTGVVNAEIFSCLEDGKKVLRSDPCSNAVVPKSAMPPVFQSRGISDARNETAKPTAVPRLSLEELQASCPGEFNALASNPGNGGVNDRVTYNHKLAMLKAKCASRTVECYEDFGALQRIRFGSIGNLDDKIRVKQVIAATRAKCGIQAEQKSTMRCNLNPGGIQNGMICR